MGFWKKCGGCLCIVPFTLSIIIYIANPNDLGNFFLALFIFLLGLILLIPGIVIFFLGRRHDKNKIENEIKSGEYQFKTFVDEKPP